MTGVFALLAIGLVLVVVAFTRARPRDASTLPRPSDEVAQRIERGERVAAIRAYRRQTGASLAEAYRLVLHYEHALRSGPR